MADDRDLAWEEIRTEHIVRDRWIDLRRSAFRFPDGRVFEPYYSYTRRDYAVVVASLENGKYLCVRQFRQGIRKVTAEFPAGGIEPKDGPDEAEDRVQDALNAAKRELDEMELIDVEQHTPEELEEMIRTENFAQTDHILAWMLWNRKCKGK